MSANASTRVMLARRPGGPGVAAFGHVDIAPAGRDIVHSIVESAAGVAGSKEQIEFHPDDLAADDEILVADLAGFDSWFQPQAEWSLERAVAEIRATGTPQTLTSSGVAGGGWTFYLLRSRIARADVVVLRAKSPSWGLKAGSKLVTRFVGGELKPVEEPLLSFDFTADAVVVGDEVFVIDPRRVETLLIDADAVKARAPELAESFDRELRAPLAVETVVAIERVCSRNVNVARRVERLVRDGGLSSVTAAKVRGALPDAGLQSNVLGSSGPLKVSGDHLAVALIDIAADLYYQPRFSARPRRVAAYRQVR